MATLLHRIGRIAFRRRRLVLASWMVAVVLAGVAAATLSGPTSDAFSIPGTESQRAIDLLEERVPGSGADGASARIVFTVDEGRSLADPDVQDVVTSAVAGLASRPEVAVASDPYAAQAISPDGRTGFASVTYAVTATELEPADRDALEATVAEVEAAGITTELAGSATNATPHVGGTSEAIGLAVAAVVLVITFGSLVAAGLPLLTAILGVVLGLLGIQVATGFFDLSSTTSVLALMLGLAVGIDYALFILTRYRHELGRHDPQEAAGRAVGTAGSAVVFAGLTVAIALVALVVVGIPFLSAMGLAAAATVLVAVAISLTLLPALLGFAGERLRPRARDEATPPRDGAGARWASFVIRRRVAVLAACVVGLGVVAIPALDLRLGLPTDENAAPSSTQRQAYDQIAESFGPGLNGPLLLAVDLAEGGSEADVEAIRADVAGISGVLQVAPANLAPSGDLATVAIIPTTSPSDPATETLVQELRERSDGWEASFGALTSVTGETAVAIDVSDQLADALLPYLAIVVGLAFVLLTVVFRSLLVPLKAVVGFLLSIAATFGAVVAVFQWGWLADVVGVESTGPIVSFLPILLVGLLFGLAMDYEVFLVSRMREEFVHGASADDAIRQGFRHGAQVVTAAALIMVAVFGGFVFAPDAIIKSIGFALALGVLLDAFVVRMGLVPAVMSLLGRRAWSLPKGLDRALPHIDVEGAALDADHHDRGPDGGGEDDGGDGAAPAPARRGRPVSTG